MISNKSFGQLNTSLTMLRHHVEIWTVSGQINETCSACLNGLSGASILLTLPIPFHAAFADTETQASTSAL